jgi:hypothetical protein
MRFIIGAMRFAELGELYDLASFFRHASLCLA